MSDGAVKLAALSGVALDVARHERLVDDARSGARLVFCGVVREQDHDRAVVQLEYQAHPHAERVLGEVAARIAAEDGVLAVAVSHRHGVLGIGDVALVAAVATAHRGQAFAVCTRLVDEVKATVPIWKRQVFADGTDEWVNFPDGTSQAVRRAPVRDVPALPQTSRDESDVGWGDGPGERDAEWYRQQRPPHHG